MIEGGLGLRLGFNRKLSRKEMFLKSLPSQNPCFDKL